MKYRRFVLPATMAAAMALAVTPLGGSSAAMLAANPDPEASYTYPKPQADAGEGPANRAEPAYDRDTGILSGQAAAPRPYPDPSADSQEGPPNRVELPFHRDVETAEERTRSRGPYPKLHKDSGDSSQTLPGDKTNITR